MRNLTHLLAVLLLTFGSVSAQQPSSFPVNISIDASQRKGELKPIWRFFGADEPNYAYMKDGQKLIGELGALRPTSVYFRTHNLLTTGDGTPALKWGSTNVYTEDANGNPIYNWTTVDRIFDTYLKRGVKPYVQIGFMPKALSLKPDPYQHKWTPTAKYDEIFTGWAYPPNDYAKWAELVYQWTKHCIDKYGKKEVETWYWEVWNEANIGYWRGTLKNSASCTITQSMQYVALCRLRALVAQILLVAEDSSREIFSNIACVVRTTRPLRLERQSISSRFMRRERPGTSKDTCEWE
jgi:xylan 1,4-beta-xylosidase